VELYTHHTSVKNLVARLEKEAGFRLAAVHLVSLITPKLKLSKLASKLIMEFCMLDIYY
jgi:hypothetical protein